MVLISGVPLFNFPPGTHSQNIQVYERSTLNHYCTLNGHIGIVTVLRLTESPHGVFMFSASSDTTVQVKKAHNCIVLIFSRILNCSRSVKICIGNVKNMHVCENLRHTKYKCYICGTSLLYPHSLYPFPQVWNLENMLPILALQRHEKPIQALAICQDSVFTGSEDMEIKVSSSHTLIQPPYPIIFVVTQVFRHFKL